MSSLKVQKDVKTFNNKKVSSSVVAIGIVIKSFNDHILVNK